MDSLKYILAPWLLILPGLMLMDGPTGKNKIIITNVVIAAVAWGISIAAYRCLKGKTPWAFTIGVLVFNAIALGSVYLVHIR